MKKTLILLLALFSAICLRAQDYFPGANPQPYPPFADSWKADPMMVTGNYLMYRMDTPAPTPAPAGFKPFYISTYGRHGARFFGRNEMYDTIAENGYQFVKSNYNWERVNEHLAQIIAR